MSKEKQIEGIAHVLCGMKSSCDSCMFNKERCFEYKDAERIYNTGYRKQSEGEWEEYQIPPIICCSECDWGTGIEDRRQFRYCPNCGAKMRKENN